MKDKNLQVFDSVLFGRVRIVIQNNEPWFVGKDVAEILGYKNPSNAISCHCKASQKLVIPESGMTSIIPERDLYRLVMRSRLESAEKFEDWVVSEVLPSIRKHGGYLTDKALEKTLADPDYMIGVLQDLKKERAEKKALVKLNQKMLPKANRFDAFIDSWGNYTLREAAKTLGKQPNKFLKHLRDKGVLYKLNKVNTPRQTYINRGYFDVKPVTNESIGKSFSQTYVTPKGMNWLQRIFISPDGFGHA